MEWQYIVLIVNVFIVPLLGTVGFMLKRITMKLDNTMSKQEVRQTVEDKLAPVQVEYQHVHERLINIEKELAILINEIRNERREQLNRR